MLFINRRAKTNSFTHITLYVYPRKTLREKRVIFYRVSRNGLYIVCIYFQLVLRILRNCNKIKITRNYQPIKNIFQFKVYLYQGLQIMLICYFLIKKNHTLICSQNNVQF